MGSRHLAYVGDAEDMRKKLDDVRKCRVEIMTEQEFAAAYPKIDLSLV